MKTYLLYSLFLALIFASFMPLARYFKDGFPLRDCLLIFAVQFASMFALLFITALILGEGIKKRRAKLGAKFEE